MDTLMSYYGGKSALAPVIASLIPPGFDVYCEPFAGSAAIFFAAPGRWAKVEILNDLNHRLINFYRVMQDEQERGKLLSLLSLTPCSREMWQEACKDLDQPDRVKAAWAFYVCHQQSFNLGRHSWRVPPKSIDAAWEWSVRTEKLGLAAIIRRLRQASLECQSFEKIMKRYDSPETIFYIDPPYSGASNQRSMKTSYQNFFLSEEQDKLLIEMCAESKAAIVLSGYPRDDLPSSWRKIVVDVSVPSRYNSGEPTRAKERAQETIWINPHAEIPRLF